MPALAVKTTGQLLRPRTPEQADRKQQRAEHEANVFQGNGVEYQHRPLSALIWLTWIGRLSRDFAGNRRDQNFRSKTVSDPTATAIINASGRSRSVAAGRCGESNRKGC
jgi:hypothetical protein